VASIGTGLTLMLAPVVVARALSNPQMNRRLIYGLTNPTTASAQRTFSVLGATLRGMIEQMTAQEVTPALTPSR